MQTRRTYIWLLVRRGSGLVRSPTRVKRPSFRPVDTATATVVPAPPVPRRAQTP